MLPFNFFSFWICRFKSDFVWLISFVAAVLFGYSSNTQLNASFASSCLQEIWIAVILTCMTYIAITTTYLQLPYSSLTSL